jgi:hypothetical protein
MAIKSSKSEQKVFSPVFIVSSLDMDRLKLIEWTYRLSISQEVRLEHRLVANGKELMDMISLLKANPRVENIMVWDEVGVA